MVNVHGDLTAGTPEDEDDMRRWMGLVKKCRRGFRRFTEFTVAHYNSNEIQSIELSIRMPGSSEETKYIQYYLLAEHRDEVHINLVYPVFPELVYDQYVNH